MELKVRRNQPPLSHFWQISTFKNVSKRGFYWSAIGSDDFSGRFRNTEYFFTQDRNVGKNVKNFKKYTVRKEPYCRVNLSKALIHYLRVTGSLLQIITGGLIEMVW